MNQLAQPISILHLEDSDLDSDLITTNLELSGLMFRTDRVWTRADFQDRLEQGRFDLILADYRLPAFDGLSALEIARELAPDTPFIFVSATLGEEVAIESLKNGATDYVLKSRLGRLASCIRRALAERQEIDARHRAERSEEEAHRRLASAMAVAEIGAFEWDVEAGQVVLDERSCAILGMATVSSISTKDLYDTIVEEDRQDVDHKFLSAYRNNERVQGDFRVRLPNGIVRDLAVVCDWFAKDGGSIGIGVVQDVTDRKRAEEHHRLVVRELHHRVKNSLATVQSVISFSLRHASSFESFQESIVKRIDALARSHSLLTDDQFGGLLLRDILDGELTAYQGSASGIEIDGPRVYLQPQLATTMSLAVHELATNAAKYGALSTSGGRLVVHWRLEQTEDAPHLHMSWDETGGPRIEKAPEHQGFGSILMQRLLGGMAGSEVDMDFRPEGLRVQIILPLLQ